MGSTTATVTGNVGGEVIEIGSGERAGVKFRLAATERYQDRRTGDWVDGRVLWVEVVCWGRLAEGVLSSVRKGDAVIVSGRLETDQYTVDGQNRSKTQLNATSVGHDLMWGTTRFRRSARKEDRPGVVGAPPIDPGDDDEPAEPAEPDDSVIVTTEDPGYAYTRR
jgi:single-strand DNA-binding protein